MRSPLPPVATAISFIDAVNRADLDRLHDLMSPDHTLQVFDEDPLVGRTANVEAWRGYFTSYPRYVIYPRQIVAPGPTVAVLGHTTGSHLGLPDDEEIMLSLIWLVTAVDGAVRGFRLVEDSQENRAAHGV
jgi:ketosteroid isomerase-like protein